MNIFTMKTGVEAMLWGCVFTIASGALFFLGHLREPEVSSIPGTYVRICMNAVLIAMLWMRAEAKPRRPERTGLLWVWGIFGALTVSTYFAAIYLVGAGTASLLNSSFGIFAVALGPWVLGLPLKRSSFSVIAGAALGLWLLLPKSFWGELDLGILLGLASGFFAGAAYLAVAKAGRRHSPLIVLMYWTAACLPLATIALCALRPEWPKLPATMGIFLVAGLLAAAAQYCMALAYQWGPVETVSAVSYIAPGISVWIDAAWFHREFTQAQVAGVVVILAVGVGAAALKRVQGSAGAWLSSSKSLKTS